MLRNPFRVVLVSESCASFYAPNNVAMRTRRGNEGVFTRAEIRQHRSLGRTGPCFSRTPQVGAPARNEMDRGSRPHWTEPQRRHRVRVQAGNGLVDVAGVEFSNQTLNE